ncbi:hypothetical protein DFH06DRAFT_625881 [Mycena polygramma]|nr:hypothetical protein DFH06DRAFT_625881 [Mycena polygramma]
MNTTLPLTATHLPYDILHEVFALATADAIHSGNFYFPVVLSHVCSSWRFAALATPIIWSALYTSTRNSETASLRSRAYFDRSQAMPVNATVWIPWAPSAAAVNPELALLAENAQRLVTLTLVCADMGQLPVLFACLPVALSALHFLHITVASSDMKFTLGLAADGRLPPLGRAPFRLPAVDKGVRWSDWGTAGITHLYLNGLPATARPSVESMWHILVGCQSTLQTFEYKGWAPVWDDANSVLHPVELPMLRCLQLFWIDDLSVLTGLMSAPKLQYLSLENGLIMDNLYPSEGDDDSDFPECDVPLLFEQLAPSCSVLEHLSLYGVDTCPRSSVDRFFAAMPALESLLLFDVDEDVEDALFQPECRFRLPREVLFPALVDLSVSDVPPADLARFLLRHKSLPVAPLRCIALTHEQEREACGANPSILGLVLKMCIADHGLEVDVMLPERVVI